MNKKNNKDTAPALVISQKPRQFETMIGDRLAQSHIDVIHATPAVAIMLVESARAGDLGRVCMDGSCKTQKQIVETLVARGHTDLAFMPGDGGSDPQVMGRFLATL